MEHGQQIPQQLVSCPYGRMSGDLELLYALCMYHNVEDDVVKGEPQNV